MNDNDKLNTNSKIDEAGAPVNNFDSLMDIFKIKIHNYLFGAENVENIINETLNNKFE